MLNLMQHSASWPVAVSRPQMWVASTLTFLHGATSTQDAPPLFWFNLFYFVFPYNLLIMGWNDIIDYNVDSINPRKKARLMSPAQLARLPLLILLTQLPFLAVWMAYYDKEVCAFLVLNIFFASFAYNGVSDESTWKLSRRPVYDVFNNIWLWMVPFLVAVAREKEAVTSGYSANTAIWLSLSIARSQFVASYWDHDADKKGGKGTICTFLGRSWTAKLIGLCGLLETAMIYAMYLERGASNGLFASTVALANLVTTIFAFFGDRNQLLSQIRELVVDKMYYTTTAICLMVFFL